MRLPERLPTRLPLVLFAILALATVSAFYLTQHLKTSNPLINGAPRADPSVINPREAGVCTDEAGKSVSFRSTALAFYLQSKSDVVNVEVIGPDGANVATMAGSGRYIHAGNGKYAKFTWNGMIGSQPAPAGTYTFHVALVHEDRDVQVETSSGALVSVQVQSGRPTPKVSAVTINDRAATGMPTSTTAVTTTTPTSTTTTPTSTTTTPTSTTTTPASTTAPTTTSAGVTPYFTPGPHETATIHLVPGKYRTGNVLIYRATGNVDKPLKLVKTFGINPRIKTAVWDGTINDKPAPAGTYLLGVKVTDSSCTSGQYPALDDPAPHSTAGAGVNVTYLSADPPVDPVPAGQLASVGVNAGGGTYTWALRRAGQARTVFHGTSSANVLRVRMPGAGLYELTLASSARGSLGAQHTTVVPLVASAVGARAAAPVLVVLPALSWQGANATDDDSDGLIDTLANGSQISLQRPLVAGLPAGIGDEAALLNFLDSEGLSYDLTTDVALAEGVGPSLKGRSGVLLDGTFTWLPTQLESALRSFVRAGGGAFADGIHSLQSAASLSDGADGLTAGPARVLSVDPFGVKHASVSPAYGEIITKLTDGLGIFSTVAALQYPRYQVLTPPNGRVASAAGVADSAVSVIGFHLGSGTVVEAGLPDFGASLASDVDAGELLSRVWHVVLR